ncbi:hypothetical protein [Hymenobacter sp. BRD67]|uniref:hypothetical protein n=1 Tax=Hymenobacter sp. BRD67 TaxID=2675877 RepID=UPI0015662739|nr:hypothetical protein [Hymenobacter sp. BRD67]QKG53245.1 hypothetical protein GKZ67_12415 [Hymenobacter sp. BRD67]
MNSDVPQVGASRLWRWLLPAAVVACLYVNYLYNAHPPAGALSNGAMSARHPTLLTPAGYAFSIWGIIFSGWWGIRSGNCCPGSERRCCR